MYQTSHYTGLEQLAHLGTPSSATPIYNISSTNCNPSQRLYSFSFQAVNTIYNSLSHVDPLHSTNSISRGYSSVSHSTALGSYNNTKQQHYLSFTPRPEYHFTPDTFLKPGNWGKFVGHAEEIREFVEEAFERMFQQPFPEDIKVSVLDNHQFSTLTSYPGVLGLSLNRRQQGLLSEIFVKNDFLARVLLTFGHELGHVLTPTLEHSQDEEAKAYAFSLAWMRIIKQYNIAGLADTIVTENPATNGLHDTAFFFVDRLLRKGRRIREIYEEIITGKLSCSIPSDLLS